jgi:prepilin-type N-terminal cleavage/methylation domain-containing protein
MNVPLRSSLDRLRLFGNPLEDLGFTLVEVLVSSVVITVAVAGSIAAVNLIVQSVRGTGNLAAQNRVIDRDISNIYGVSERFGACTNPQGNTAACPAQDPLNSSYYFPEDTANVDAFFTACNSANAGTHITANFITAIGAIDPGPDLGEGVTRAVVERVDGADPANHLVRIEWRAGNRELREIRLRPIVSSWCP